MVLNERKDMYKAALDKYDKQFSELHEKVDALSIKIMKLENGNG